MDAALVLFVMLLPCFLATMSSVATALHSWQEATDDGAPIWEYLQLPVSDTVGLASLIAFGGAQVLFAWFGYASGCRWCLWALLAVRLGDCVVSHWLPWLAGRRPNPGLATTPLYGIDAAFCAMALADLFPRTEGLQ